MQLHRFNHVQKLNHHVQNDLLQHEAEHNLLLGVLHRLLHNSAISEGKGKGLAVAILTSAYKANPTSNHIYQKIGYRPICDWHDYAFLPKVPAAAI